MATPASTFGVQDSPLLNLPGELRNQIYELVCGEIKNAIITAIDGPRISVVQHPLSQTCRQLYQEFSPFALAATRDCSIITLHVKNFDLPPSAVMLEFLRSLPPVPTSHKMTYRWYIQKVFIDNDFVDNFANNSKHVVGSQSLSESKDTDDEVPITACDVQIDFDVETLDLKLLEKARNDLDDGQRQCEMILNFALRKAVGRYHNLLSKSSRRGRPK